MDVRSEAESAKITKNGESEVGRKAGGCAPGRVKCFKGPLYP